MLLHLQCVQINMEIKRQLENLKKKNIIFDKKCVEYKLCKLYCIYKISKQVQFN